MTEILSNYSYTAEILNPFFLLFLFGQGLKLAASSYVEWTNEAEKTNLGEKVRKLRAVHPLIKKMFTFSGLSKSISYNNEHKSLSDLSSCVLNMFSTPLLLLGAAPFSIHLLRDLLPQTVSISAVYAIFAATVAVLTQLVSVPFSLYSTFSIEERWGFNKTTKGMFAKDTILGLLVSAALVSSVAYVSSEVLVKLGRIGLKELLVVLGLSAIVPFVMELLGNYVIMPLFNTFKPLKEGSPLYRSIQKVAEANNYPVGKILIMDASKRSTHANAFITGFGRFRKIVLFDTLLKNYTTGEITAILSHEIAHGKLKHLAFGRLMSFFMTSTTLSLAVLMMYNTSLYHAFGFSWITPENVVEYQLIGIILAQTVIQSAIWVSEPLFSWISRKFEYAADNLAVKIFASSKRKGKNNTITKRSLRASKESLISALVKLETENLSDVIPSKTYEFWNYDHPSLKNRVLAIQKGK